MNAYEYLVGLCNTEDHSSYQWRMKGGDAKAPKVEFLLDQVRAIRAKYPESNMQGYIYNFAGNRNNIVIYFPSYFGDTTIGFCAHHDVANPKCDNVFDNQASVSHLLALAERLAECGPLHHNILLVITDGEEVGGIGAEHFSKCINRDDHPFGDVVGIVNLELTAAGTHYWVDDSATLSGYLFKKAVQESSSATHLTIGCPFNDGDVFRRHGIDSACVGMITRNCVHRIKTGQEYTPRIWDICHSNLDNINLAREKHMDAFTDVLHYIAQSDWTHEIKNYEVRKPKTRKYKPPKFGSNGRRKSNQGIIYSSPYGSSSYGGGYGSGNYSYYGKGKSKKKEPEVQPGTSYLDGDYASWWEDTDFPY